MPFVGACIHVPPPPANQIVYVKSEKGFEVAGQFDPVWVTGTLKTETAFTGLADAGYTIDAEASSAARAISKCLPEQRGGEGSAMGAGSQAADWRA